MRIIVVIWKICSYYFDFIVKRSRDKMLNSLYKVMDIVFFRFYFRRYILVDYMIRFFVMGFIFIIFLFLFNYWSKKVKEEVENE